MGRLSRHRKIKSCDPFFKGQQRPDISSINAPVQDSQLDSQPIPKRAKRLFDDGQRIKLEGKTKKSKKVKKKLPKKMERKPGETKVEYFQRLDKQASEEVNNILMKERHVSQKRKEFLKAQKEKANKKRQPEDIEHKEFVTDQVKFGEVVNEPPSFTAKPRHANVKDTSTKNKTDSLLLQTKLSNHQKSKTEVFQKSKKRKHMNPFEQQTSDKRRLEAIAAYREMKQKNLEERLNKIVKK